MPGESSIAGFGIALAVLLLVTTVLSIGWARRWEREAAEESRVQQVVTVGEMLVGHMETLLAGGDGSAVRRMVINAAHRYELIRCRVVTNDGRVFADIDPRTHEIDTLVSAKANGDDRVYGVVNEGGVLNWTHQISDRGEPVGLLEIEAGVLESGVGRWNYPLGIGVAGLVTLGVFLVLYRRARRRLRTSSVIRDALLCLRDDDRSDEVYKLDEALGEEARVWNGLLEQIRELRAQSVDRRLNAALDSADKPNSDLHLACDTMPDGLLLMDRNQQIIYANGAASVFVKLPREGILGKQLQAVLDDPRVISATQRVQERKGSARGIVELDQRETGSGGVLRIIARPVRQSDSATAMIIIQDVTQLRIAQESHNAFLTQAVHELRTPLTNIRLHVELVIEQGGSDPSMQTECLNVINSESGRLERIVSDMLSVAEIEAGALALVEDDVHMEAILNQLQKDHGAQAREKQIALSVQLPPKMPLVRGDQEKIQLALHNLVGNAIKYTPAGGSVMVEAEPIGDKLHVRVIDTGFGIGQDDQKHIFDKFYRAKDERIQNEIGSGLGLSLAAELMRMHAGEITFESELHKGSTFTLTMPLEPTHAVA